LSDPVVFKQHVSIMPKYQRAPYTHDLYPGAQDWVEDSIRWNVVEDMFRDLCRQYAYGEIRTPVFEYTDLFTRSIGEGTDIVSKEMFSFQDQGKRNLTLRPEGTAPSLRAYLDSPLASEGGVTKIYYIASIFRQERGAKGRYRQHQQCGVEALGSDDPALDSEVIQLAMAFYKRLGLPNLILKINSVGSVDSRAGYLNALKAYVEPHLGQFSDIGKSRFENNPFRLLDTKDEREIAVLADAPKISEYLSTEERDHLEAVCGYLADAGIAYEIDPYLVRGFDYYTRTAFEIQSPDVGAQSAVGGGGRYNQLVEDLGGKPTPGIGFGIGIDRTMIALQSIGVELPIPPGPDAFIVTLGDAARKVGIKLLADLRSQGYSGDIDYTARSMKSQMRAAGKAGARYAVILGDNEIAQGVAQVKSLTEQGSSQQIVPLADLIGSIPKL